MVLGKRPRSTYRSVCGAMALTYMLQTAATRQFAKLISATITSRQLWARPSLRVQKMAAARRADWIGLLACGVTEHFFTCPTTTREAFEKFPLPGLYRSMFPIAAVFQPR